MKGEYDMNEDKLKEMLLNAKPIFEQVDEIGRELRETDTLNLEYYHSKLDKLSGCYTYLVPRYKTLAAYKKNAETSKYMLLKQEAIATGVKFVNAIAEKEASNAIKQARMVRNIFEGYVEVTFNNINTCKKHMTENDNERRVA